ncbi:MAG: class II glutamine amidotransferase [Thermoanaerobaculia bacterium]|nr:class II glutamine amidotransferase [Thermoanaerobaculia bacterium]
MCRWLAYSGAPIYLEDLLFRPEHSLIDQSLAARTDDNTTNGDGFGIGWYGERETPGVYRDVRPAWNDDNLRDLAANIRSRLFFAHVRSATVGLAVQQSNCHPFRSGRWLFMHNGYIEGFPRLRRRLLQEVSDDLFPEIRGTTDSEVMFYLALTFGLADDPAAAIERMAGFVEAVGRERGVAAPLQMTVGVSDGRRIHAVRYSTRGRSKSLFHSLHLDSLREINPDLPDGTWAIVSEPLTDLSAQWEKIPEATVVTVCDGEIERRPFTPRPPG